MKSGGHCPLHVIEKRKVLCHVLDRCGRTNPLSNTLRFTLSFDFEKGFGKN